MWKKKVFTQNAFGAYVDNPLNYLTDAEETACRPIQSIELCKVIMLSKEKKNVGI